MLLMVHTLKSVMHTHTHTGACSFSACQVQLLASVSKINVVILPVWAKCFTYWAHPVLTCWVKSFGI